MEQGFISIPSNILRQEGLDFYISNKFSSIHIMVTFGNIESDADAHVSGDIIYFDEPFAKMEPTDLEIEYQTTKFRSLTSSYSKYTLADRLNNMSLESKVKMAKSMLASDNRMTIFPIWEYTKNDTVYFSEEDALLNTHEADLRNFYIRKAIGHDQVACRILVYMYINKLNGSTEECTVAQTNQAANAYSVGVYND